MGRHTGNWDSKGRQVDGTKVQEVDRADGNVTNLVLQDVEKALSQSRLSFACARHSNIWFHSENENRRCECHHTGDSQEQKAGARSGCIIGAADMENHFDNISHQCFDQALEDSGMAI